MTSVSCRSTLDRCVGRASAEGRPLSIVRASVDPYWISDSRATVDRLSVSGSTSTHDPWIQLKGLSCRVKQTKLAISRVEQIPHNPAISMAPKATCNRSLFFLFPCTSTTNPPRNCVGLHQAHNLYLAFFNGELWKLEVWQTLLKQRCNSGWPFCAFALSKVWSILQLCRYSLIRGESQCLETGNEFSFI